MVNKKQKLIILFAIVILASFGFAGKASATTYYATGTLISTNLLDGVGTVSSIDSFFASTTQPSASTTLYAQFATTSTSGDWYSAAGSLNGTTSIANGTSSHDLPDGWSGANFYYKMYFNTTDTSNTPELDEIRVDYTSNVAPTVGTVHLDNDSPITVIGNSATTVVGTTTITDDDGWADISSATSTLYRIDATTCNSGETDPRWCYAPSCTLLDVTTTDSRDASCTVDVWFLAEPTSGTSSYDVAGWEMDILATDGSSATGFGSTSQELGSIYYIDASSTINYGTVALGATSSNIQATIYNAGNIPFDPYLEGDDMVGTTTDATISMAQQRYSSSTQGDWDGTALSDASTGYNLNLPTPTATTTDSYDDLYWMIKIPDTQLADDYYGTNTVSAGAAM